MTTDEHAGARVVLVTGGSRGVGEALVQAFLDAGDRVATCSRAASPQTEAWAATYGDRFHFQVADLADRAACSTMVHGVVDRFGRVDVLVNNAGVARDGVLGLFSDDDVDDVVDINLKGTFAVTKLVVRQMLKAGPGRIINISSIVGLSGYRGLAVYGATKAALDGFTRALARELGGRGITVNSVAPGYLRTEMSHGLDESQLQQIARRTPLGRLGEPSDVAAAVLFLASDAAAFITGHVLVVDGGVTV
ncbi:MAG TPA: 3-oxoacyl-ACP reductase FabG [Acidimicrobiales bacterium]|jgi:3-oxoacyl-[acyl-carrier protein] reductase|nr:3-oxoacyl-ACP reductase FabG [Acidimicrobiales bacterium]